VSANNQFLNPPAIQCLKNGALNTHSGYCYDAAGNLMTDNSGASHYCDAENHLKSRYVISLCRQSWKTAKRPGRAAVTDYV